MFVEQPQASPGPSSMLPGEDATLPPFANCFDFALAFNYAKIINFALVFYFAMAFDPAKFINYPKACNYAMPCLLTGSFLFQNLQLNPGLQLCKILFVFKSQPCGPT